MRMQLLGAAVLLAATTTIAQPPERVRVLIGFTELPGPAEEALVQAAGGDVHHRFHLMPAIAATVPVTALDGLSRNPIVTVIEADGVVQANDAELDAAWGVKHIGSGAVHDLGNKGTGVKVAIVDTGIDCSHGDLIANCAGGYDFVNNDNDPTDDEGHGTHVAGTVAGADNGTGVVGVAPEADLYAVKVLNANGSGYWSQIAAGIEWCYDNGIQVTNNSYGSASYPGSLVARAFDNSYAAGMIHVASAGNSGSGSDTVGYPGKLASVIAVAATNSSDTRASFSSTGPDVELAAPGVGIKSSVPNNGYASWSGTSMASPHVAGVAALVIASGVSNGAEVRQQLVDTADELGAPGRDNDYGWGLVDALEAADGVYQGPTNEAPNVTISSPSNDDNYDSGSTIVFAGSAIDLEDGDLSGGLVWTSGGTQIGAGPTFNWTPADGTYTVTAAATDSEGATGSAPVTVTLSTQANMVTVTSITYRGKGGKNADKHLDVLVSVANDLGAPVEGASVSIVLRDENSNQLGVLSGVTDAAGSVTLGSRNVRGQCFESTVQNVDAPPMTWDHLTPDNHFCKVQ